MSDEAQPRKIQRQFWTLTGEEVREAAYGFADALWNSKAEQDRRARHLKYASQYVGRDLMSLADFEASTADITTASGVGRTTRNIVRTLVDTALSRFAKTETRVQFLTDGGTPAQQERAETATDASNALLEQTHTERRMRKAALHGCLFDLGNVKTIERPDGPEVEHVPAWEVMHDPADAHRGNPTMLVQRFPADRQALVSEFATPTEEDDEETQAKLRMLADDIRQSNSSGLITPDHTQTETHCIVYEIWKLPRYGRKGRHLVVTDTALCLDEEWTDEDFPFVFFGWSEPVTGAYPEPLAAIVSALQEDLDGLATRRKQILRLNAVPRYIEEGPGDAGSAQLRGGADAIGDLIKVPPGTKITELPFASGPALAALTNEEQQTWQRAHEMTGINEQSTIGSRPAGLNSAPAQREWNEINQDRLSLVALDYQDAHVDQAERLLSAVAKIPGYTINVKDPNGAYLKRVKASDLNLDDSDYVIQRFPVGALPTTPTGKLAAATDLLQAKAIEPDEWRDLTQFPDLKATLNPYRSGKRAVEKFVGRMLRRGRFEAAPEAMMSGPLVKYAAQVALAKYLDLLAEDIDEASQQILVDFMEDLRKRTEKNAAAAPPALPAGPALPPDGGGGIAPTAIAPAPPIPDVPIAPPGVEMMGAAA